MKIRKAGGLFYKYKKWGEQRTLLTPIVFFKDVSTQASYPLLRWDGGPHMSHSTKRLAYHHVLRGVHAQMCGPDHRSGGAWDPITSVDQNCF